MKHSSFSAIQKDSGYVLHPLNNPSDVAAWQQKATIVLSTVSPTNGWSVSVLFTEGWSRSRAMYTALDKATTSARLRLQNQALPALVNTFLREHWVTIAISAYATYQKTGPGCWVFTNDVSKDNYIEQEKAEYIPIEQCLELFSSLGHPFMERLTNFAMNYNPDTDLIICIPQGSKPICAIYGSTIQGLPNPKSIWEEHKDDSTT